METHTMHAARAIPPEIVAQAQPPAGFSYGWVQYCTVDAEPVYLLRFERHAAPEPVICGEHYSALVTPDGLLKGETRMDAQLAEECTQHPLPTADQAQAAAMQYLKVRAPDLVSTLHIHWVAAHSEKLLLTARDVAGGLAVTVTGMKVKCHNTSDDRWFWVIVGPGEQIITFERDIVWNTGRNLRQTELWLHDLWLVQYERQFGLGFARLAV